MDAGDESNLAVQVNRHVELELVLETGEREALSLDVVADAAADFEAGFLGESAALAQAILGHQAGETLPYRAGDIAAVRIVSVAPELSRPADDKTEQRAETVRKAVRQSDRTNAIIFASTVDNKWGDYDPGALKEEDWE